MYIEFYGIPALKRKCPLDAQEVAILIIAGAANDENVVKMTTLPRKREP